MNKAPYRSEKETNISKKAFGNVDPTNTYLENGKFDNKKFTEDFLAQQKKNNLLEAEKEEEIIAKLQEEELDSKLLDLSVRDHLVGIKTTFLASIDNLINLKFDKDSWTKEHRLFYLGLLFLIIVIMYSVMSVLY